jgi:hypothetical protein
MTAADARQLRTFRFPSKHHTLHYFASCQAASHNFDHPNVVNVERLVIFRHDRQGGVGHKSREDVFRPILLRRYGGGDSMRKSCFCQRRWEFAGR